MLVEKGFSNIVFQKAFKNYRLDQKKKGLVWKTHRTDLHIVNNRHWDFHKINTWYGLKCTGWGTMYPPWPLLGLSNWFLRSKSIECLQYFAKPETHYPSPTRWVSMILVFFYILNTKRGQGGYILDHIRCWFCENLNVCY